MFHVKIGGLEKYSEDNPILAFGFKENINFENLIDKDFKEVSKGSCYLNRNRIKVL